MSYKVETVSYINGPEAVLTVVTVSVFLVERHQ